jgi:uncharacterized lipoprotein YmbA
MTLPASRRRLVAAFASLCAVGVLTASCASPSLTLYTLGLPSAASDTAPLGAKPVVIEVRRVAIPDYLDSQDIVVRDGTILVRSTQGRWASRVSLGVTHFLTARLARRRPDALITDQPQIESPNFRLFVTISTLDITSGGTATLDADWLIVPRDSAPPPPPAPGPTAAPAAISPARGRSPPTRMSCR